MALTPEEKALMESNDINPTPAKRGSGKLDPKVTQTTAGLSTKLTNASQSAVQAADQDTRLYAQTYLNRFTQNMEFINGQLADVWSMPGKIAAERAINYQSDLPPINDDLARLFG